MERVEVNEGMFSNNKIKKINKLMKLHTHEATYSLYL